MHDYPCRLDSLLILVWSIAILHFIIACYVARPYFNNDSDWSGGSIRRDDWIPSLPLLLMLYNVFWIAALDPTEQTWCTVNQILSNHPSSTRHGLHENVTPVRIWCVGIPWAHIAWPLRGTICPYHHQLVNSWILETTQLQAKIYILYRNQGSMEIGITPY